MKKSIPGRPHVGGSPNAQFGPVKVGGDWIASNLLTGVDAGPDSYSGPPTTPR